MTVKTLLLPSRFDFNYHTTFHKQTSELLNDDSWQLLQLDFSDVQYLDSSALGMMVLLAKKVKAQPGRKSTVKNATGAALEILNLANMHKLYDIE